MSLSSLFARALSTANKAANLPTLHSETQDLILSALNDLRTLSARINDLALFSPNEALEDISTSNLLYLLVPYVTSEVQGRVSITEGDGRLVSLDQMQTCLRSFVSTLETYEIIPEEDRKLFKNRTSTVTDPARRRELKIKQYQKQKDLRARIEVVRKRRGQQPVIDRTLTDFELVSSLLPSPQSTPTDEEDDSTADEVLRETSLVLLHLMYAQAHVHLESLEQELELLRSAPPPQQPQSSPPRDPRERGNRGDDTWKLDLPSGGGIHGQGPLLDPSGKPLRPFTILPAGAADRARLQAQVLGPGHRLPTMTIDEYLQIERERGNIISGGGPASAEAPTSSEQLAMDAEEDGTIQGETKEEEKRQKDEKWARYTDDNPRGAGNTMNRG